MLHVRWAIECLPFWRGLCGETKQAANGVLLAFTPKYTLQDMSTYVCRCVYRVPLAHTYNYSRIMHGPRHSL